MSQILNFGHKVYLHTFYEEIFSKMQFIVKKGTHCKANVAKRTKRIRGYLVLRQLSVRNSNTSRSCE